MRFQRMVLLAAVGLAALVGGGLSAPVGQCPSSTPPGQKVFLPSDSNCAEFYLCSHGEPYLLICPGDLYFNPATSQCDFRHNVPCDVAAPPVAPPVAPQQAPQLSANDAPVCPDPPGPYPALFPNPANCSTYYMCSGSIAVLMPCPEGLLFNNDTWTCDHPWNVVCPEQYGVRAAAAGPLTSAPSGPAPTCPPVDGIYPTFFPNDYDCTTYYMCSHGVAHLFRCPAGLHFNRYTNTCDYHWRARCTEVEGKKSQAVEALVRVAGTAPTCPSVDGKYPTFFPNDYDCTTFYMCSHGVAHLFHCPAGLHFNRYTNTCDYPWRARCTEVKGKKSQAVEPSTGLVRAPPVSADTCPEKDGEYPVYLPNPYDCTTFYLCSNGVPYLHDCPDGLHFNSRTNTCDFPWHAGCKEINGTASAQPALPVGTINGKAVTLKRL